MGDNRTYEYLCLLRAITSEDGMTADFYEFKKSFMETISNQIVNSIRGIIELFMILLQNHLALLN
jgi:GMP synthase (glutamine-hydrolysing)